MGTRSIRKGLCSAALALACGGAVAASDSTRVDLLDCAGLPCVTLQFGAAKPVKLLLDSGDATSLLDMGEAKALGLPLEPYKNHEGKVIPGYFTTKVTNATLGRLVLPPVTFLVLDLQKSVDGGTFPPSNGLLSYVELKDRVVTLDYHRHRLEISDTGMTVAAPKDAGTLTYPTFGQKGPHIVATTGFQVNGKSIVVQVDTLYSGTMLIYPTSVTKLGLDSQAAATGIRKFPFTDDGVEMIEGQANNESFAGRDLMRDAPLYFATPKVHLPDAMFDGTVGGGLLAGRRVTFDFHSNRFWVI
jgi:hypothetical protein